MNIAIAPPLFAPNDERRRAALTLALALLAGGATEALFWHTGFGLNFWVWDLFMVAGSALVLRRGSLRPTAVGAIAACVLLGFSIVRYESDWALSIAVPANLAILALLPLLLRDRVTLAGLSGLPVRAMGSLAAAPRAVVATAQLPAIAVGEPGGQGRTVVRGVTRGLLLGLPTAGLFALLLATDTDFSRALANARASLGDAVVFALWSVLSATGYLITHALHGREPARPGTSPHDDAPYRLLDPAAERALPAPRVSVVTWATVIGQVTIVFALFVAANLRHLFGGSALVRAPGTVTYATYLHAGFVELLLATVLSLCLVLIGHRLLRPRGARGEDSPATRVPGGKLLASLEGALLVLTGITVASCWQRLRIYEDAYGASHLRLGVAFVELAILGVLVLTVAKVVARAWTGHAGAVLAFGAALAVVASGFNADAYVARTNLDRATAGHRLDVAYLLSLSGDAHSVLAHPYVQGDPALAAKLQTRFCPSRERSLRAFRGLGRCVGRDE